MTKEEYAQNPVDFSAQENRGKLFCIGAEKLTQADIFVDETCMKTPMDFSQDMDFNLMAFPPSDKFNVSLSNQILISILPRGRYVDEEGNEVTGKELYCKIFRENIYKIVKKLFTEWIFPRSWKNCLLYENGSWQTLGISITFDMVLWKIYRHRFNRSLDINVLI